MKVEMDEFRHWKRGVTPNYSRLFVLWISGKSVEKIASNARIAKDSKLKNNDLLIGTI